MPDIKAQNETTLASVKAIYDAADEANTLLDGMKAAAQQAGTTLNGIYQDAMDAQTSADDAQASATQAGEYASRALGNLSTVQSVTETLNWITSHGTMTLTQDVVLDPSHVYFVADQNGDYVVGGQHYSVVTEPDVADISTYYELSIDESLNNYVATHLALTNDGLVVTNDDTKWYVLIKNDGIDIVDNTNGTNKVVASYRQNIELNSDSGNKALLSADGFSIQESHGVGVFRIIAQNEPNGTTITHGLTGNGTQASFWFFGEDIAEIVEITIDDIVQSADTYSYDTFEQVLTFNSAPADGSKIKVKSKDVKGAFGIGFGSRLYWHGSANIGKYSATFGENLRASGTDSFAQGYDSRATGGSSSAFGVTCEAVGQASHAEGYYTSAYKLSCHSEGSHTRAGEENGTKGQASHAEGYNTSAFGDYSHAEGMNARTQNAATGGHAEGIDTVSVGEASHAQNLGTGVYHTAQTAIGKYNNMGRSDFGDIAFVIGNGEKDASTEEITRSDCFTVDWSGNVEASGDISGTGINASGNVEANDMLIDLPEYQTADTTDKAIYDAVVALGWDSDVLIN